MPDTLVREKPLLFSGAMVNAIVGRGKTQTRRLLKPDPAFTSSFPPFTSSFNGAAGPIEDGWTWQARSGTSFFAAGPLTNLLDYLNRSPEAFPLGRPGDRLWVRETWQWLDATATTPGHFVYRADGEHPEVARWRPSIFMPRRACRLELEIVASRLEPLSRLTRADARAEGIYPLAAGWTWDGGRTFADPITAYADLWDAINPEHPWTDNPTVWVITFRRMGVVVA